jgi:hypothetical protein
VEYGVFCSNIPCNPATQKECQKPDLAIQRFFGGVRVQAIETMRVKDAESKRVATSRIRVLLTIPDSTTQRHEFLQLSWEKTVSAESILGEDMSDLPR